MCGRQAKHIDEREKIAIVSWVEVSWCRKVGVSQSGGKREGVSWGQKRCLSLSLYHSLSLSSVARRSGPKGGEIQYVSLRKAMAVRP